MWYPTQVQTCGTVAPRVSDSLTPTRNDGAETANRLRTRLRANHARLSFPHATGVLRELLPDLHAAEPDWLAIAEVLGALAWDGTHPPHFAWNREVAFRPDEGQEQQEHIAAAQTFASGFPSWLIDVPLAGNPNGLGRHQHGLVLLETAEFLRLIPPLFSSYAPRLWARTWPNLLEAAIDFDKLDPYCDGLEGYFVELFRGGHTWSGLPAGRGDTAA